MSIYKKMRLDRILVDRGLAATRSRAADLIRLGAVSVEGETALKPGVLLDPGASLTIEPDASPFVSRGGLKLAAALDAFCLNPKGLIALDIGASTTFDVHVIILSAGKYGIEGVANLAAIKDQQATVIVGVPRWESGSGGPARVLALV